MALIINRMKGAGGEEEECERKIKRVRENEGMDVLPSTVHHLSISISIIIPGSLLYTI